MHVTVSNLAESDIEFTVLLTLIFTSQLTTMQLTRTVVLESGGLLCRTAYHWLDTMSIPYTEKSSKYPPNFTYTSLWNIE